MVSRKCFRGVDLGEIRTPCQRKILDTHVLGIAGTRYPPIRVLTYVGVQYSNVGVQYSNVQYSRRGCCLAAAGGAR